MLSEGTDGQVVRTNRKCRLLVVDEESDALKLGLENGGLCENIVSIILNAPKNFRLGFCAFLLLTLVFQG
jgi:hypothetical protein